MLENEQKSKKTNSNESFDRSLSAGVRPPGSRSPLMPKVPVNSVFGVRHDVAAVAVLRTKGIARQHLLFYQQYPTGTCGPAMAGMKLPGQCSLTRESGR